MSAARRPGSGPVGSGAGASPTHRHHRVVRGRLAAISVRAAMGAGAWVGFALGLLLGAIAGVLLAWFAGAVLAWQRELAFTLGLTRTLLPFGDQLGLLGTLSRLWYAVIPATALAGGIVFAVFGALVAGLVAAAYNRTPRHAVVLVEIPEPERPAGPATGPGERTLGTVPAEAGSDPSGAARPAPVSPTPAPGVAPRGAPRG